MSEFNFKSPSIQITEREIPISSTETVNATSFGLVGEMPSGPAFEPIRISSNADLSKIFGGYSNEKIGSSLKYLTPFYADSFLQESNELYVTRVLGLSGYTAGPAWSVVLSVSGDTELNQSTVAVIRAKGGYDGSTLKYFASGLTMSSSTTSMDAPVTVTVSGLKPTSFTFSMNPDAPNFITKVLGTKPTGGNLPVFVEAVYPNAIKKLMAEGKATGVAGLEIMNAASYGGFASQQYTTPKTPFIVSELRGSEVHKLFRFYTIADGEAANSQIKISFENINPVDNVFDVVIRQFNDTDDNVIVLERFSRCVMDPASQHFVGRRIGATMYGENDLYFALQSNYVYLEMAEDFPIDAVPAGFEGYEMRSRTNIGNTAIKAPYMPFKTTYTPTDKVPRVYLGVSERAYDGGGLKGLGIDQNLFNFHGNGAVTQMKGFHMDSAAPTTRFVPGAGSFKAKADIEGNAVYASKSSRKFTLVPAGGFDGFDIYRESRTTTSAFKSQADSDYYAYLKGVRTFSNQEETSISMLATPGINWDEHADLVRETLDMIETGRKDCLYIVDAPDLGEGEATIQEIVDLFDVAGLDSSYATTYYPYIQMENKADRSLVYIPASGEAARTMALTDREKFLWFANAGVKRGVIPNAKRTRIKLKDEHRDVLHQAGINPIAQFRDVGVDIFGQRTTLLDENKSLSRINVRKLLNYAKKFINAVSRGIQFEQNDDTLVSEFMKKVNPELSRIQRERGLRRFDVTLSDKNTPETLDRRQLFFKISLTPTSSMEELGIELEVTPSGNTYSE
jgi:hypothetical protein